MIVATHQVNAAESTTMQCAECEINLENEFSCYCPKCEEDAFSD